MTSSAKTQHVYTTTEHTFITPVYRRAQWLTIPSVSIMLNCQLVCFCGGLLQIPSHKWHQWREPIGWWGPKIAAVRPTNKAWVWVPNAIMAAPRIPQLVVFAISHPISLPILPSPFVSYTDIKKEWQHTMKFSRQ